MIDSPGADDTIRRPLPAATSDGQQISVSTNAVNSEHPQDFADSFEFPATPRHNGFDGTLDTNDDFHFASGAAKSSETQIDSAIDRAFDRAALNPLVSAAAPLLWLAGRISESSPPEDVNRFRERVLQELKQFETAAMARDIAPRLVRMGRYALAATIDDIILNTRWGSHMAWANRSLVSLLYNETWGGERFYDLLSQMRLNPEENIDGLEFMAICLALGFTGKYRVKEGGREQLARLRYALYRVIREVRGPYDRDLSPPWEPVAAPHAAPKSVRGAWIIVALAILLLVALWVASSIILHQRISSAVDQINALTPNKTIAVAKPALPDLPQLQLARLRKFLAPEIAAGQVTLTRQDKQINIQMPKLSFPSGGMTLAPSEHPLITRIGAALNDEKGPIRVIGYTDNIPVASGSHLHDNMAISSARAQSVAAVLRHHLDDPSRVTATGHGAKDPIATNATAAGRNKNRRADIRIDARQTY